MSGFSIGIRRWEAWASYFDDLPEQQISAELGNLSISREPLLQPASVKPILRRRLSPLGRVALWCAEQVVASDDLSGCHCIFASQHGEVARTTEILQAYNQTGQVSPTAFSLSVHNAIAGIYSIANGIGGNITALAAGEDSLMMALLESAATLQSNAADQVLCVVYDQPIPKVLNKHRISPDFGFAIALLLGKCETHQVSIEEAAPNSQSIDHPFSTFLHCLLGRAGQQYGVASKMRSWQIYTCPSHE